MIESIKEKLHSPMGRDIIWTFIVQIIVMLCGFIITKILSNRLSIDDFGLYNVIKRSASVLSFVMLAGTGIALPRYMAIYKSLHSPFSSISFNQAALLIVITIAVTLSITIICLPQGIGSLLTGSYQWSLLIIALLYATSMALASFLYAYFRGTDQFSQFNLSQALIQCGCVVVLLLIPTLTVFHVYLSWISILLLGVFAFSLFEANKHCFIILRRYNKVSILQKLKETISYASPRMVGDFFLFSINAFPLIFLSKYHSLQDVSYFSVGLTFVTLGASLFMIIGYILLPYVSAALARHEIKQASHTINRLLQIYIVSAIIVTAIFFIFTPFMIRLFFSSTYLVAIDITRVLLLAILPQSVYLLYRNPIDAISKTPYNTINLGICLAIMIVAFYQLDSLEGLAYAFLGVSILKGIFSIITWEVLKKKKI